MNLRRRLALLEALAAVHEAAAKAMPIVLESDDPPNVERSTDKTGPRSPFTGGKTLAHLQRVYSDAQTSVDRERVLKLARKLASQGLITDQDVATIKKP